MSECHKTLCSLCVPWFFKSRQTQVPVPLSFKMRPFHFQNDPAATSGGWPGGGRGGADDPDQRGGGEVGGEPDGELGGERGEGAG